jgi:RNA polymerase sigma factor (sigma-70 family)
LSGLGVRRVYSSKQKMTDSHTLLASYVRTGSESAFRELVSRYLDLVYSTAFRLVGGDAQSAQDVAQTVFVALADKAGTLPKDVMLGGWLHEHTRFVAGKLMRTERRRQLRERQVAEMNAIEDHSASNLAQVAPVLDEAIGQLEAEDRTAILLRFFERKDFRTVGEALGSSEDAARKRVDRALEKLHVLLKHRGATLSAAALGTALATEAVTATPAGLVPTISSAAIQAGTTITTTVATTKAIAMTTLQKALVSAAIVAAVTAIPVVVQHQAQLKLREQNQALRQQGERVALLAAENERLSNLVALAKGSEALAADRLAELLRLRGELGSLRDQTNELARLRRENRQLRSLGMASQNARAAAPPPEAVIPREAWTFAGYGTPEAALQSVMSAMNKGDVKAFWAGLSPEGRQEAEQYYEGKSESEIAERLRKDVGSIQALRLDRKKASADGGVGFVISASELDDGAVSMRIEHVVGFRNVGGEWKLSGVLK